MPWSVEHRFGREGGTFRLCRGDSTSLPDRGHIAPLAGLNWSTSVRILDSVFEKTLHLRLAIDPQRVVPSEAGWGCSVKLTSDQSPGPTPPLESEGAALPPQSRVSLESLKIRLTDAQVAIRKDRYARQGFVPPGVLWRGILLSDTADQQIALDLGFPFETREIALADEDEARLWIVEKALEAPELNTFQRVRIHLNREDLLLKRGRERMASAAKGLSEMTNPAAPHDTRAQIAKASRVSKTQVFKVEYLLAHADPPLLAQLEVGKVRIGTAYDALQCPTEPEGPRYNLLYLDLPSGLDAQRLRALPVLRLAAANAVLLWWTCPCDLATSVSYLRKWKFTLRSHLIRPRPHLRLRNSSKSNMMSCCWRPAGM